MSYKLIIFDFDGTLADTFPWFLDVFDILADRFRFKRLDRSNLDALRRMNSRQLLEAHGVPLWKVPMIGACAKAMQGNHLNKIKLFDGVSEVMNALGQDGVKLAVVTSNAYENVVTVFGQHTEYVDYYSCGASLFGKAAKFRAVMKLAGVGAAETLAIGDEIRDIEAARECGIAAGAVSWGYAAPDRLQSESPDYLFRIPADIMAVIRN